MFICTDLQTDKGYAGAGSTDAGPSRLRRAFAWIGVNIAVSAPTEKPVPAESPERVVFQCAGIITPEAQKQSPLRPPVGTLG